MSSMNALDMRELLRFRYDLDIPAFVRAAVEKEMKKEEILVGLHIISNISEATEKMPLFAAVSREKGLSREEILVWLHVSYGGLLDSEHLSRKLGIPMEFAEKALAALETKGIIGEGWVL